MSFLVQIPSDIFYEQPLKLKLTKWGLNDLHYGTPLLDWCQDPPKKENSSSFSWLALTNIKPSESQTLNAQTLFLIFSSSQTRLRWKKPQHQPRYFFRTVVGTEKDQEVFAVRDQDITIVYFIAQYEIAQIAKRTNKRSQMDVKYFSRLFRNLHLS